MLTRQSDLPKRLTVAGPCGIRTHFPGAARKGSVSALIFLQKKVFPCVCQYTKESNS